MADDPNLAVFQDVLEKERAEIRLGRIARLGTDEGEGYIGLALSGGGIRSATFNLGVLQALAEGKILRYVDYLSTVSGGGYIGSWLIAWLKRSTYEEVERELVPQWDKHEACRPTPQIEFLRDYSNYLTPQLGFLSADTWAAIAIFLRNLLLNLTIFVSLFTGVLLLSYLLAMSPAPVGAERGWIPHAIITPVLGFALAAVSAYFLERNLRKVWDGAAPGETTQRQILARVVVPLFAAAWLLSASLGHYPELWGRHARAWEMGIALSVAAVNLLVWASLTVRKFQDPKTLYLYVGLGFHGLASLSFSILILGVLFNRFNGSYGSGFRATVWAPPLAILIALLAGAFQVGLMGLLLRNELREWTARLGGWILSLALAWVALFGIAFYSPLLAMKAGAWVSGVLTVGWLVHAISGAISAFSANTGKAGTSGWLNVLVRTATPVFLAGLFILLSFGIYKLAGPSVSRQVQPASVKVSVAWTAGSSSASTSAEATSQRRESLSEFSTRYWQSMSQKQEHRVLFLVLGLVALVFGVLLSLRVDVNDFSMHLFYRNRLVRCYLGASRPDQFGSVPHRRQPNAFTGFDPHDDVLLADFAGTEYAGPYPILNATLNLTHGERLAWQERKAEAFAFSPLYCGGTQNDKEAYRPTRNYAYPDGPYLGTAFAISGAAVSPYLGFHISAAAGFLLTVFNARLTQWLPNPSQAKWNVTGPRLGLIYLLKELFGLMDDDSNYVCLSDGGHFENLGIYELVRRRCRYIIASDAGADPGLKFEDLGNAIRKCWADFGAAIQIDVTRIRLDQNTGYSHVHCAVGTIQYSDNSEGKFVYLKASLTGDEPTDVLEYRSAHGEFPHQSTVDQWFDEAQFESYRKLGYHIAQTAFNDTPRGIHLSDNREQYFQVLKRMWRPSGAA